MARKTSQALLDERDALEVRIDRLDERLRAICRENPTCRRPRAVPGIGPTVRDGPGRQHRRCSPVPLGARELAAWIGLAPRQHSTGGQSRLGGMGRGANHSLRRQPAGGARAVALRLATKTDPRSRGFQAMIDRRSFNKGIVAMANETARMAWAMLTRDESCAPARGGRFEIAARAAMREG